MDGGQYGMSNHHLPQGLINPMSPYHNSGDFGQMFLAGKGPNNRRQEYANTPWNFKHQGAI